MVILENGFQGAEAAWLIVLVSPPHGNAPKLKIQLNGSFALIKCGIVSFLVYPHPHFDWSVPWVSFSTLTELDKAFSICSSHDEEANQCCGLSLKHFTV